MPVSYTHLADNIQKIRKDLIVFHQLRVPLDSENATILVLHGFYIILPVSYTHLDVYKRQILAYVHINHPLPQHWLEDFYQTYVFTQEKVEKQKLIHDIIR